MLKRFLPVIALVAACWVVFGANNLLWHGDLARYGIHPRHTASLPGILFAPFLHASLKHLVANSVPLLVLGGIICARSGREFSVVSLGGIVLGGGLTWILARNATHIGASGLVFCLFGYLTSMAYFRRTVGSLILSAACLVGYGGIIRGVLPTAGPVSWEGHLAGLLAGIALAWAASEWRKTDAANPPTPTTFSRDTSRR